jgi:hypothetical protein
VQREDVTEAELQVDIDALLEAVLLTEIEASLYALLYAERERERVRGLC